MVTMRKTLLLALYLIPTIALSSDPASTIHLSFNNESFRLYKNGVFHMIAAGERVQHKDRNKALAMYRAESRRIISFTRQAPKKLFPKKTRKRIQELFRENKNLILLEVDKVKQATQNRTYDSEQWQDFNKAVIGCIMQSLQKRGVRFPKNDDMGHAAFLEANADITRKAASYLIPGEFFHWYPQHLNTKIVNEIRDQQLKDAKAAPANLSATSKIEEQK